MTEFKVFFSSRVKEIIIAGLLFGLMQLLIQCNHTQSGKIWLKNGDLLFVTAKESGLSGANNVTQKQKEASFDHIGILEKKGNRISILHAAPKGGSQKQNLKDFIK